MSSNSPIIPCGSPVEHGIKVGGLLKPQTVYTGISSALGSNKNAIYCSASHLPPAKQSNSSQQVYIPYIKPSRKMDSRCKSIKHRVRGWFTSKLVAFHFNWLHVKQPEVSVSMRNRVQMSQTASPQHPSASRSPSFQHKTVMTSAQSESGR